MSHCLQVLRLFPPLIMLARKVLKPLKYKEYDIAPVSHRITLVCVSEGEPTRESKHLFAARTEVRRRMKRLKLDLTTKYDRVSMELQVQQVSHQSKLCSFAKTLLQRPVCYKHKGCAACFRARNGEGKGKQLFDRHARCAPTYDVVVLYLQESVPTFFTQTSS